MVTIIENYAKVQGVVKSIKENTKMTGYHQIEFKLEETEDVRSFPNLAKVDEGKIIKINLTDEQLRDHKPKRNQKFSTTVRKFKGLVYFMK